MTNKNHQIIEYERLSKKTKGTVSYYSDESLEFTPYGKGEPVYEASYKVGEATLGKTKGTGKQNFVAKLKCSAAKPYHELDASEMGLKATNQRINFKR